jgi:hypothetical protein
MSKERNTLLSTFSDADLAVRWREHLDAADDNDDYGGHVGISRYHRAEARAIGDEQRRRAALADAKETA